MPYEKKAELPDEVKALPEHAHEIWMSAFNSAWEQYEDEEKAFATAWAAVKKKYRKEGDRWVKIEHSSYAKPSENKPEEPGWFEIFKAGTHTDSSGNTREWSLEDIEEIASSYNPGERMAPIVIGHPEMDSPAYGWIDALKVEGEKLLARPGQIVDQFREWVRQGLYKKVSIALYPDLTLRHVGFLGAAPPSIKGLKEAAFGDKKPAWIIESEAEEFGAVTQGESPNSNKDKGGIKMTFKDFYEKFKGLFIEAEKGLMDTVTDRGHDFRFTEADLLTKEKEAKEAAFAEAQKKIDAEKKEKEEAQKRLREIETQARRDKIHAFCEGMAKEGKLIPAWQKMGIEEFLFNLDAGKSIKFAEDQEKTPGQWFMEFLSELPKVVTFKEVTPKDGPGAGSAGEKLSVLVKIKKDEKKDLSYSAAFSEVQRENPELAKEYLEEIRPNK